MSRQCEQSERLFGNHDKSVSSSLHIYKKNPTNVNSIPSKHNTGNVRPVRTQYIESIG